MLTMVCEVETDRMVTWHRGRSFDEQISKLAQETPLESVM